VHLGRAASDEQLLRHYAYKGHALLKNITLGWKGQPCTNTQAYLAHSQDRKERKFCD